MSTPQFREVAISDIELGENVRTARDEKQVKAIAASARDKGILVPIELETGTHLPYRLVDGWHRLGACELLGVKSIPAIIRDEQHSESARIERQLCINSLRSDLNPLEKAVSIERLLTATGWTPADASRRLGISQATLSRLLAIRTLPESIQRLVESGEVPADKAYQLSRVANPVEQERLAKQVASGSLSRDLISDAVRRERKPCGPEENRTQNRVVARLAGGFSLSLSGPGITFESLVEQLERFVSRARKVSRKGVELRKFISLLNAEAQAEGRS